MAHFHSELIAKKYAPLFWGRSSQVPISRAWAEAYEKDQTMICMILDVM